MANNASCGRGCGHSRKSLFDGKMKCVHGHCRVAVWSSRQHSSCRPGLRLLRTLVESVRPFEEINAFTFSCQTLIRHRTVLPLSRLHPLAMCTTLHIPQLESAVLRTCESTLSAGQVHNI